MIPNLRESYGKLYRVGLDPCATSWKDINLHVIEGRVGCVYVHGEDYAGVEIETRRWKARQLMEEAGFSPHLQADDVYTYLIPWSDLDKVIHLIRPRKRRQLSEEEKKQRVERLREFQFHRQDATDDIPEELEGEATD